jgi:hypothetical protein
MCIYVREITNDEGNQLKRILRRSGDSFKVKRAQVILVPIHRKFTRFSIGLTSLFS